MTAETEPSLRFIYTANNKRGKDFYICLLGSVQTQYKHETNSSDVLQNVERYEERLLTFFDFDVCIAAFCPSCLRNVLLTIVTH